MELYIKNIILYPKDKDLKPRVITFSSDKINVITGNSQRGKSAIIDIIDYCLGSSDCHIPVGRIRNTVDIFALYIKLNGENVFIARDNPNEFRTYMYFFKENVEYENRDLRTNEWLKNKDEYKVNRTFIKNHFSHIAGFENISNDKEKRTSLDAPASFRDTSAFQFQTQNIIANPATMFYKTDSWEHLSRLKTIFPLVLGYKSYEILKLENEIIDLTKEENRQSKKIEDIKKQYENWQSDIYEYYSEALNLGLTNSDFNIKSSRVNLIKSELQKVVLSVKSGKLYRKGAANRFSEKLNGLNKDRGELIRELDVLKIKLNKINELYDSSQEYFEEVVVEKEIRLRPIEWFLHKEGTDKCPFCDSESEKAINELLLLKEQKNQNKKIFEAKSTSFSFDKEKLEVIKEIEKAEESLKIIDANIDLVLKDNKVYSDSIQQVYKFIGKIEHALDNLEKISPSGDLETKLQLLKVELASKKTKLKRMKEKFDKDSSLRKLSEYIGAYVKTLPIEDKKNKIVHLDPDQSVNIKVEDTKTGDINFLSRLGSGANYMCYHLSTLLGLHEYFYKLNESSKKNYIPSFIIFDQPSQVYYPEQTEDSDEKEIDLKDLEDTKEIFRACIEFMNRTNDKVQVIILEHANPSVWKDIDQAKIHISGRWRGRKDTDKFEALIPSHWY